MTKVHGPLPLPDAHSAQSFITAIKAITDQRDQSVSETHPTQVHGRAVGPRVARANRGPTDLAKQRGCITLITQGKSRHGVAPHLIYPQPVDTIKTYIRSAYHKISITSPLCRPVVGH